MKKWLLLLLIIPLSCTTPSPLEEAVEQEISSPQPEEARLLESYTYPGFPKSSDEIISTDIPSFESIEPVFTLEEYLEKALSLVPDGFIPVRKDGNPAFIALSLNSDYYTDFALLLQAETLRTDPFSLQNIYQEILPFQLKIQFFTSERRNLINRGILDAGAYTALSSISSFNPNTTGDPQYIKIDSLSTQSISSHYFYTGEDSGAINIESFELKEDFNRFHSWKDLDSDGKMEILEYQYIFSAESNQSFLTSFSCEKGILTERNSINLSESINRFINLIKTAIRENTPERLENYLERGNRNLNEYFRPREEYRYSLFSEEDPVDEVILPELQGNLFNDLSETSTTIHLRMKTISRNGIIGFYDLTINLAEDPFLGSSFLLTTPWP